MTIKNIAVIGAGTMGNGIAHVFAQNNFSVNLIDVSQNQLDKAIATIKKNLDRQVSKNFISEEIKNKTIENITTFTSLKDGVQKSDLVVEAATENIDLKLKIFKEIDEFAPQNCILASNTSSISITKIASVTQRPSQV
ncbi:MAG TPA: 3-hydroxyacyl-CoA dehydrogenase NAD-binding domain-containing protein, partial [Hanamia sp.]|nr:3-hydroxyacyl-CoA dehydrogenase NAD-binding domain-containing protein [Hanamia sp.]